MQKSSLGAHRLARTQLLLEELEVVRVLTHGHTRLRLDSFELGLELDAIRAFVNRDDRDDGLAEALLGRPRRLRYRCNSLPAHTPIPSTTPGNAFTPPSW